jgi:hypothetical protein
MGEVIGPVGQTPKQRYTDWYTMREIRNNFKWATKKDPVKYRLAIDAQRSNYQRILEQYVHGSSH